MYLIYVSIRAFLEKWYMYMYVYIYISTYAIYILHPVFKCLAILAPVYIHPNEWL